MIVYFIRKTNSIKFDYKLRTTLAARLRCVKDPGILLHYKIYFRHRVNLNTFILEVYIYSCLGFGSLRYIFF